MTKNWQLEKTFPFEAAHVLPDHKGKCSRLHGHSWKLVVGVSGTKLIAIGSETNMLIDYGIMKEIVQPLVDMYLDHWHLNHSLNMHSPTSEKVAEWVYIQLLAKLVPYSNVILDFVRIEETCTSACTYMEME